MNTANNLIGVCALLASVPGEALAQAAYPNQPIRFVVTTAAGGGLDNFGRLVAKELTPRAGQQVIVDNRPGANGTIASAIGIARTLVAAAVLLLIQLGIGIDVRGEERETRPSE